MKKLLALTIAAVGLLCPLTAATVTDFRSVDRLFNIDADYHLCKTELKAMLDKAASASERAEILWRLARVQVMLGGEEASKEARRAAFAEGVDYASEAMEAAPKNPACYMWHCAAFARECQTHSLGEQAAAVPVMMGDVSTILEKLGRTDCSEAWQALAEIYFNHPFKSNDNAINFVRQAVLTIPVGECRTGTCVFLAKMLHERNWSAAKRSSETERSASKAAKATGNIDKYSWLDGMLGADFKYIWCDKSYGNMSDREEASALLEYAAGIFKSVAEPGFNDKKEYKELTALQSKYNE